MKTVLTIFAIASTLTLFACERRPPQTAVSVNLGTRKTRAQCAAESYACRESCEGVEDLERSNSCVRVCRVEKESCLGSR